MSRPVVPFCVTHRRFMVCHKNGFTVTTMADFGPYEVHRGDEYRCPVGDERVVVGWADRPHAMHNEPGFHAKAIAADVEEARPEAARS